MSSVIAIIRADDSHMKKNALFYYQKKGQDIVYIKPDEVEKTYIITDECVYASSISIQTLTKRVNEFNSILNL